MFLFRIETLPEHKVVDESGDENEDEVENEFGLRVREKNDEV